MSTAVKFTFGNSFDDNGRKAQELAEQNRQDEIAAMRLAAREEGFAQGRDHMLAGIEAASQSALDALTVSLAGQVKSLDLAKADLLRQCADLARIVGERLAGRLVEQLPVEAIETLVRQAFSVAAREPRLVIRVSEPLLDRIKERTEALAAAQGFAGRLIFLGEPDLAPGDARIEWADGGAERRFVSQLADLDRLIDAFLDAQTLQTGDV